ncbi:MAG: hypothetical protein KatS3mg009_0686 [Acidimicrobiia bacterium]|nr:MAG: hypothetical protein KatS3mg009_0686 [Acidimicrobiia bacterium]
MVVASCAAVGPARGRAGRPAAPRRAGRRRALIAAVALVAAGCARPGGDGAAAGEGGWAPEAVAAIVATASGLAGAGLGCGDFDPYEYGRVAAEYEGSLPVPAAMGECTGPDGEHLELAAFADGGARRRFVEEKAAFLCRRAREAGLAAFGGFPYVEAGRVLVQPDTAPAARRIAGALGGRAARAGCG